MKLNIKEIESFNQHFDKLHLVLIENVKNLLPSDDPDLQYFAQVVLKSISFRILKKYRNSDLVEFINDRYKFFINAVKENGNIEINHSPKDDRTILEVVSPFAEHIFVTIEAVLNEYSINIKFRAQTFIDSKLSGSKNSVDQKKENIDDDKYVLIYFSFDELKDENLIEEIADKIRNHLLATSISYKDQKDIELNFQKVKDAFSKQELTDKEVQNEQSELFKWISENCFQFGYCSFRRNPNAKEASIVLNNKGRGILSKEYLASENSTLINVLEVFVWKEKNHSMNHCSYSLIKATCPILRFNDLMCLRVGIEKSKGIIEENIFVGQIKASSLHCRNLNVPVIRTKMQELFKAKDMIEGGYRYNQVIRICNVIPKFELFRTPVSSLLKLVENLIGISNPNDIYCFYSNLAMQTLEVTVVVPFSYDVENINKIVVYLNEMIPHSDSENLIIHGQENNWIQFYFTLLGNKKYLLDTELVEKEIKDLTKDWKSKVFELMQKHHSVNISRQLCDLYLPLMPKHYKASCSYKETVADILFLEQLAHSGDIQFNLTTFNVPASTLNKKASLLYIYSKMKIDLNKVMPILQNFGFYILDQINSRVGDSKKTHGYVQSYRIQDCFGEPLDLKKHRKNIIESLEAVFMNKTENDQLNTLVVSTDLNWRDVNVIQLYRNYYLQLGVIYNEQRINNTLIQHPKYVMAIFHYFMTKFSPENKFGNIKYRSSELLPILKKKFIESLRDVSDIADDVILRTMFKLVESSIRTNYFIPKVDGETFISVKIDPSRIDQMPKPIPYKEMYVHDVGFEATHIRFGGVARGGLRWSDRKEDFRTEVLGLVKTQQAKNVVIVPVGSKGGFVLKRTGLSREEMGVEARKQYRKFIAGMLDITDNINAKGESVFPNYIMAYDQLDPYLVVAADKGTATFSDEANSVSKKYNFWLGDAFASGGSVGYDHKKEGITARGGWECVKLHFKEMGKDIQSESTDVVGIGDMSGDVFGNGMLLSKCIKLKAAFNHIHIFIDPSPLTEKCWTERKRLFDLPRSTWKDFDQSLISQGGGIFDRFAKEISLSNEMKEMLDCSEDVLNGEQLIKKVLKMKTELIWFGGIGTYMKDQSETHFQVGDQANNSVRINISDCRAKVIGEGANLGMTQLSRMVFNQNGGRLNTDAIDNSAGVNMSDYEVNIKILLQQLLQSGHIKNQQERVDVLVRATDEVSDLVLVNNREQHRLISMDQIRSFTNFKRFKFMIHDLITTKGLDHHGESIPSRGELERMDKGREILQRPVLAKLQAFVKLHISEEFLAGELIDDLYFSDYYKSYFPQSLKSSFEDDLLNHQLHREIITTQITNYIVNRAGIYFFNHIKNTSGYNLNDIAKLYLIFDDLLEGEKFRNEIYNLESLKEKEKYDVLIEFEDLIQYCCLRSLQVSDSSFNFSIIEKYKDIFNQCYNEIDCTKKTDFKKWSKKLGNDLLAKKISSLKELRILPNIIFFNTQYNINSVSMMKLINNVNDLFGISWLSENIKSIDVITDWELNHKEILLKDLESHKMNFIKYLIENNGENNDKNNLDHLATSQDNILKIINKSYKIPAKNYLQTLTVLKSGAVLNLTSLSVGVSKLNIL